MNKITSDASAPTGTSFWLTLRITITATLGGFLFGFDSGVINGTVEGLQTAFSSKSVGTGFSVASMLLGCAIGAFAAGRLADEFGRRTLLIGSAIFFLVSAWGSGIANGTAEFVVYRIIGGLAVGAASVMTPAYISEIAPASIRGRLSSMQQIAIISGLTAAFLSNYAVANAAGSSLSVWVWGYEAWRWMFWIEIIPALVFLAALIRIPESPRYLVAAGKGDSARLVLSELYGDTNADSIFSEIRQSLDADHKPRLTDILSKAGFGIRPIVWVGIGLAVFQQLVGINVIFYYGAVLWQSVGFSESDALLTNIITGGVSILACLIALGTIDRVGRKPLLLLGSAGMAVTLGVMAAAFSTASGGDSGVTLSPSMGLVALVAANLYVFFFNLSWGPVMWVMLGEMFPNQIRGSGLAVSGFFQWMANFGITMTFPILLITAGLPTAYALYAVAAIISFPFVLKFVMETRGVALEAMRSSRLA